jgi:hypothetical protein
MLFIEDDFFLYFLNYYFPKSVTAVGLNFDQRATLKFAHYRPVYFFNIIIIKVQACTIMTN